MKLYFVLFIVPRETFYLFVKKLKLMNKGVFCKQGLLLVSITISISSSLQDLHISLDDSEFFLPRESSFLLRKTMMNPLTTLSNLFNFSNPY